MIAAVIFDMDGVLFNTERLAIQCWDDIGLQCGLGKVGYMVYKTLGRTTAESVKIFQSEFGERYNNELFQKLYKEWLDSYYSVHPVPVKEGVYVLLEYLKSEGIPTAVASSSSRASVMHHLESAGISQYFDKIICGDMVEKSKPEPDIYLTAAAALGIQPEDCLAVEDSRSGLWSAHRAGCKVVMVPDIWECDSETAEIIDRKYDNLTQFANDIKNLFKEQP